MNMTDDTNELDSYGVWVKNGSTSDNSANAENITGDTSDMPQIPDVASDESLDLPDFDSSDFSDMFKDDSQFSTSKSEPETFSDDLDSTLSTDELANITDFGDVSIEEVEAPDNSEVDSEAPVTEDFSDITTEDFSSEVSFDDVVSEPLDNLDSSNTVETTDSFEEVSFEDEEISLDDFMTEGFSDESVAAGNNGYEPGAEPQATTPTSTGTEELSLDDFLDGDSFDMAPPEVKQQEETIIEDEPPLEMEINFDDSADSIQTEDNVSIDTSWDDFGDDEESVEIDSMDSLSTEEVSLDDFSSTFEASTPKVSSGDSDISTEEIDLSDFGIDANAEETPITQNVEESKLKDTIVDYDLSVGDENTTSAPVVNEIKTDTPKQEETPVVQQAVIPENSTVVENSLLQQIVADLSGLKDEINKLKQNLEDLKTNESNQAAIQETVSEPNAEPVVSESKEDTETELNFEETKADTGFFGEDDGDETIALSFDELDNIMNNSTFADVETVSSSDTEIEENDDISTDTNSEETPTEDITENIIESESTELPVESEASANIDSIEETSFEINEVTEEADTSGITIEEDSTNDLSFTEDSITEEDNIEESITEETSADDFTISEELTVESADETVEDDFNFNEIISDDETAEVVNVEPVLEEEISFNDEADDTCANEEALNTENVTSEEEITEEITIEDTISVEEESPLDISLDENTPAESIFDETSDSEDISEEISFDFEDENLEEPVIDEISIDEDMSSDEEDDLPEEISIPKDEDMLVESTSSDFMDSIKDSTEEEITEVDSISENIEDADLPLELPDDLITEDTTEEIVSMDVPEETITEESLEEKSVEDESIEDELVVEETREETNEETVSFDEDISDDIPTVDKIISAGTESLTEEADISDNSNDETLDLPNEVVEPEFEAAPEIVDITETEEEVPSITEETSISFEEEPVETSFDEVDNLNNDLSEQNIDYLTKEDVPASNSMDSVTINSDLKQDIKSVLLYMDQLLENLPEEKIVEFAKSDEFTTYKKLFSELGLS